ELMQPLVLLFDFGDALLELAGRALNALERFAPAPEAAPSLAQLRIDLGRRRLAPQLELAGRVLEHDPQLGHEHAAKLLHELGLRKPQRLREPEVLHVVALDQTQ